MKIQHVTVVRHSWFDQSDANRQILEYFARSLQTSLSSVTEMQDALHDAAIPFQRHRVLPFQCRKALAVLTSLNEHIEKLCALFSDMSSLPLTMIALRYRFLDELYYIREQAGILIDLIDSYYVTCITPSPQRLRRERAISELFTMLLQHIADMPDQANFLLHEAKFQERRLHLR